MRTILTLLISSLSFFICAQSSKDKVVPLSLTLDKTTPSVTLEWELGAATANILLFRREKDATEWFTIFNLNGTDQTTFEDSAVEIGKTYEYGIQRTANNILAYGYMSVAIDMPHYDNRGTVLIFVEAALEDPLEIELGRLNNDLRGDGWKTVWHSVATDATVAIIKDQIVADYNNDPENVKSVMLLGEIPVPYSGNTNWDGHQNHQGAWAADTYYGDIDGNWTDVTVNNTSPSRAANDNIPGDGKFDHSIKPSASELAVGRVDFSNLMVGTFGESHAELMRRYLNKNHNFRSKQYVPQNQALVDDNFGYFGGEAFAASGYRNFYPLVGKENTYDLDWFSDTDNQSFLFGYGCGGGSYVSASGIGHTNNFASDSVNIVFAMLFGSYHGDWDSEDNPFMPAALASKGSILSCSWAGRPHWFYHPMAAGETLGYCAVETQNTNNNAGYFNSFGSSGTHVTLLGDPTLRAHMVEPISNLTATLNCDLLELSWDAPVEEIALGYHVYRAAAGEDIFTQLTTDAITENNFTDNNPPFGEVEYQVRTLVLTETPSGCYFNTSTGVFLQTDFEAPSYPSITTVHEVLTCDNPEATVIAATDASNPSFEWSGPNGFMADEQTISITIAGAYTLVVTDGMTACTNSEVVTVLEDVALPESNPSVSNTLTCVDSITNLFANPSGQSFQFLWEGPNNLTTAAENFETTQAGNYTLTVMDSNNGCFSIYNLEVLEDMIAPIADAGANQILDCLNPSIVLDGTNSSNGNEFTYEWFTSDGNILSGDTTQGPVVDICGTYQLTVTNVENGCTASDQIIVLCDFDAPDVSIVGENQILCEGESVTFEAQSTTPGVSFFWEGPGITDPENPIQTVMESGNYILTVTAANGCASTATHFVTSLSSISISVSGTIDCDGFYTLNSVILGGMPPYQIVTDPPNPIPPSTLFTLTVIDANGCVFTETGITQDFEPLAVEIMSTNETVSGANDGTATVEILNGEAPMVYEWSNGEMTQTITDLAPATYSVTVTDAIGCISIQTVEILGGMVSTQNIEGLNELSIFPNPTTSTFQLVLILENPKPVTVEILDARGLVLTKMNSKVLAEMKETFDWNAYAAGVYLCKIWIDGQVIVKRVVKF